MSLLCKRKHAYKAPDSDKSRRGRPIPSMREYFK